jgi:hypothetical protein
MQSANSIVDVGTLTQDVRHGPLPLLRIVLTVVTGVVDAVSYLGLGQCVRRQHDGGTFCSLIRGR